MIPLPDASWARLATKRDAAGPVQENVDSRKEVTNAMTGRLLSRLFGTTDAPRREAKRGRDYVSEFSEFMDRYLKDHPEAVRDRNVGFGIFWNRKVDFKAQAEAVTDRVPEDSYGFAYSAWQRRKKYPASTTAGGESAADRS